MCVCLSVCPAQVEEEVVKLLQTINSSVPVEMYNSTLRKIFDFERELANVRKEFTWCFL